MTKLALVRHGQSAWNLENRFTGWWDADLTEKGEAEARHSGTLLKGVDADFRAAFTSVQTRAIRTLWMALTEMGRVWVPVEKNWQLNERHYGGLTGLDRTASTIRRKTRATRALMSRPRKASRPRLSACCPIGQAKSPPS